jgi:hypothetical protein
VTHTRKAAAEDFLEEVSGTLGLTGAADSVLVLKRDRQAVEGTLSLTGRDIEERELAIAFTSRDLWTLVGAAADVRMSQERREILDVLLAADPKRPAVTPTQISKEIGKNPVTVRRLLMKMRFEGHVHAGLKFGTWLPGGSGEKP